MTLTDLRNRIWAMIARGCLSAADGTRPMRVIQAKLFAGEVREDVEHFEPYGFTSEPHVDSEPLVLSLSGNRDHSIAVCIADRRYRLRGLKTGEVALYDDLGQKVHLTRDGIDVYTPGHLHAVVKKDADITVGGSCTESVGGDVSATVGGSVTLKASAVTIDSANVHITGDVAIDKSLTVLGAISGSGGMAISGGSGASVDGSITTTGDVTAGGVSLMNHVHDGDSGGTTSTPK